MLQRNKGKAGLQVQFGVQPQNILNLVDIINIHLGLFLKGLLRQYPLKLSGSSRLPIRRSPPQLHLLIHLRLNILLTMIEQLLPNCHQLIILLLQKLVPLTQAELFQFREDVLLERIHGLERIISAHVVDNDAAVVRTQTHVRGLVNLLFSAHVWVEEVEGAESTVLLHYL